jgi:parallel beta-helix repeat protein
MKTKINKIKLVLVLAVISLILISANFAANTSNPKIFSLPITAEDHDPIIINGNDGLATFISNEGLNGEGTENSPYIIESFNIDDSSTIGITIDNTSAYLIIQNCIIQGVDQTSFGIYCNNTENININKNQISEKFMGIRIRTSSNLNISENSVSECLMGIDILNANYSIISQNSVNQNTLAGFFVRDSNYNTFLDNTMNHNFQWGLFLEDSNNNTFSGNVVSNTFLTGIVIEGSSANKLLKNQITNNSYGISIGSADNNEIYFNNIYENRENEAYEGDTCTNNQWDNGTTGNYWGNYTEKYPEAKKDGEFWDTPYEIDGDGLGMDNFPLVKQIEFDDSKNILGFPTLHFIIFISIGVFLLKRKVYN